MCGGLEFSDRVRVWLVAGPLSGTLVIHKDLGPVLLPGAGCLSD